MKQTIQRPKHLNHKHIKLCKHAKVTKSTIPPHNQTKPKSTTKITPINQKSHQSIIQTVIKVQQIKHIKIQTNNPKSVKQHPKQTSTSQTHTQQIHPKLYPTIQISKIKDQLKQTAKRNSNNTNTTYRQQALNNVKPKVTSK